MAGTRGKPIQRNAARRIRKPPTQSPRLFALNKPYGVLCQFSSADGRETLAKYVTTPGVYPAGRLDRDSEGLLLLTNDGQLQHRIANPQRKMEKVYCVQVDGRITDEAAENLAAGLTLNDGPTRPCKIRLIDPPTWLWQRDPPVRYRAEIPTSWAEITLTEGRNRQVRRMTAAVGFPTLRLIRTQIGPLDIASLPSGSSREIPLSEID